ncbi:MAG: signal peptidase II [Bacillota bacterium]|nr:signal peptidase II [Bacillota bacterium]
MRRRALAGMAVWGAVALTLDRVSKLVVARAMAPGESLPVWPGVFHLTYVRNPGAAFGLLPGWDGLLVVLPAVVTLVALWAVPALAGQHRLAPVAGGLVVGGALGNLLDRMSTGLVTDFLDFRVWPVFNLADTFIVAGAGLLILSLVRGAQAEARDRGQFEWRSRGR